MIDEATTTIIDDSDIALTDEVMKQAYPTFYGQLVRYKKYPPKDTSAEKPRYRIVYEIKPFDIEVNNERGTISSTIFFAEGDERLAYTAVHNFHKGLRDNGVHEGRGPLAVGKCMWWKTEPGRNGFRGNTMPVAQPKGATIPPAPADWDFDAWVEKFGEGPESNEDENMNAGGLLPQELWDELANLAVDQRQGSPKITRLALEQDAFTAYDPPTLNRTLSHLVDTGVLTLDDGKYVKVSS